MESINEEDQLAISTAECYLQRYPLQTEQAHQFSEKDQHLNPQIILKAALDFAPTVSGRVNIAKAIVNADENFLHESFNTRLEELAKQIFSNLLVPSMFPTFVVDSSESRRRIYSKPNHATISL